MNGIEQIAETFFRENDISVRLSYDMPQGYETAFGTYDCVINTLFLNMAIMKDAPEYEILFYLYHELRHAVQYLHPERCDKRVQESRFYVVLYNGCCFRLEGDCWRECMLDGAEDDFVQAYMGIPYEMDANAFAYEKTREVCGDLPQLRRLYESWLPEKAWTDEVYRRLFARIDAQLAQ